MPKRRARGIGFWRTIHRRVHCMTLPKIIAVLENPPTGEFTV